MAPHSPAVKLPSRATSSLAAAMGAHRWSHAIAKAAAAPPRKIRIVHVLAPEVIKTDARHFRELVQRLTGKPNGCGGGGGGGASSSSSESAAAELSSQPACSASDAASGGEGAGAAEGGDAATAGTIKAEVKEEGASPEEWFVPALAEGQGDMNDVFFQGLEDFLFSSCHTDGFSF